MCDRSVENLRRLCIRSQLHAEELVRRRHGEFHGTDIRGCLDKVFQGLRVGGHCYLGIPGLQAFVDHVFRQKISRVQAIGHRCIGDRKTKCFNVSLK